MVFTSTSDPDTNQVWIRVQSGLWIWFRIVNSHLEPGRQKRRQMKNFMLWLAGCFLIRAGCFCSMESLHGVQRINILQFFNKIFFLYVFPKEGCLCFYSHNQPKNRQVLKKYFIRHCFICRPLDSTVYKDAWIEPRGRTLIILWPLVVLLNELTIEDFYLKAYKHQVNPLY